MEHLILEYLLNIFIISQDKISLLKFFGWVMFEIKVLVMEYLVLEYLLNIIISGDKFFWLSSLIWL
jgi:hypothetical protein